MHQVVTVACGVERLMLKSLKQGSCTRSYGIKICLLVQTPYQRRLYTHFFTSSVHFKCSKYWPLRIDPIFFNLFKHQDFYFIQQYHNRINSRLGQSFSFKFIIVQDQIMYVYFIIQMANRPKNNFSDKLKRLGCNQLNKQNKTKSRLSEKQPMVGLVREKDQYIDQRISGQILEEMRRQIDGLQHKLMEAQREREKKDVEIELLNLKIGQKNVQFTYLTQELAQSRKSIEIIKKKLEYAQSELQNMKLRQKMESITIEISKEKQISSPLKHQKHRKGKFSEAILPSVFGSHKKFEFRSPDLVVNEEVIDDEIRMNHTFLRSPFSGYLIEEWQRTHNQRNVKQLQVANLQSKITSLKKENIRQQKQIEALKADKSSGHEFAAALQQIRQQERRNKLVLLKLRESEKKRKELSNLLKLKGQIVEEDKFFGFSTIADINQIVQKSTQSLKIDSNVIEIVLQSFPKKVELLIEKQVEQEQGNAYKVTQAQMLCNP